MALKQALATDYRVDATYWNIDSYGYSYREKSVVIIVAGYADEAARKNGGAPMAHMNIPYQGDNFMPDLTRADIYELLKKTDKFIGAEDA